MDEFKKIIDSWIGTQWRHFQRIKGSGVDCAWFVVEVAKELGWLDKSTMLGWYPQDWAQHNTRSGVIEALERECVQIERKDMKHGDVLCYKYGKCASHVGFYVDNGIGVHAHIVRGVVYFPLLDLRGRFHSVWRFRCRF